MAKAPGIYAPDGSMYITLTDGAGNPATLGRTDGSAVAAGSIGEVLTTSITLDSVSMTNNSAGNIGSLVLTAGDWDIWASIAYLGATASITYLEGSLSLTTGTRDLTTGNFVSLAQAAAVVGGNRTTMTVPARPLNVSASTTIYLVGFSQFTLATLAAGGRIYARRRT